MPRVRVSGVIVEHVWDDNSASKYEITIHKNEDNGTYVMISYDNDYICFHKESWPEISAQIDNLFKEHALPESKEFPDMPDKFYEALGWMHAECCVALDRGEDPRSFEVGDMVKRCIRDLSKEQGNE